MKRFSLVKLTAFITAVIIVASFSVSMALAAGKDITADAASSPAVATTTVKDKEAQIAEFKAEVIRLINIERQKNGVSALTAKDELSVMANVRAEESSVSFSHTRPNGTRCFTIFAEYGMKYRAAGENLAYGFSTPANVVAAWMNSAGHRKNILDPDFKYIGIGYFVNANGTIYCSQLFYTPKTGK